MEETMTPQEFKQARHDLGLTQSQMAYMLDTTDRMVRRVESTPDRSTHQPPPARWTRLVQAYLDGHRPHDWPRK
jgi:DNA-binding transcriptional regulator YiaG